MTNNATPRPWVVKDDGPRVAAMIVSERAGPIASLGGRRYDDFDRLVSERMANAAMIVRAVNAHDALRAARWHVVEMADPVALAKVDAALAEGKT